MPELIVGIDLGTTNSEIAAFVDGKPQVIGEAGQLMLPSCVGISPAGELLIGEAARNQMLLYPEFTVRSVKRLMGTSQPIKLGDRSFTPPEVSALILRELARWAEACLGEPIKKAVITVPAYFSDAQRSATREAGELAGLEVVRIVNEPTAASLAYGLDSKERRTVMVYDLGGGTLDVSIVRIEGEVTEVLASHGDNQLGGDDFDQKLVDHILDRFRQQHGVDLRDKHPGAYARVWWAAEAAKRQLSYEPYTHIREESLVQVDGRPLHLDIEISRQEYEGLIRPLVEKTLESVSKAMADAALPPSALDAILLVGGSTRTPLVIRMLEELSGKAPRQDLHPDLCVALGAGVLASRLSGHDVERVLVDVSPFSFGPSYVGDRGGYEYPHCYHPLIKRNTPLPVTRTEEYFTAADYQTGVEIDIYQGDDPDALRNVPVGHFKIEGLTPVEGQNPVLCRMRLDLDGILHVTAIEKNTGLSKHIAITGATRKRDAEEIARSRDALEKLFAGRIQEDPEQILDDAVPLATEADGQSVGAMGDIESALAEGRPEGGDTSVSKAIEDARAAVARCRGLMPTMHADDQEEAVNLIEDVTAAVEERNAPALATTSQSLREFLFFVEGK